MDPFVWFYILSTTRYGFITTTPKPHWGNADVIKHFKKFGVPIEFDTDVNAPALAEVKLGNHGYESLITVCYSIFFFHIVKYFQIVDCVSPKPQ